MKLSADIVYDNLIQSVMIESYGVRKNTLSLHRPKFFTSSNREFEANHLYVSLADRLPRSPILGAGVVIITVGGRPPVSYLNGICSCFVIQDNLDLLTIFNLVQEIFNKYDDWAANLQHIINTSASIKEMVDISFSIFNNPMVVIGANFNFLAYSDIIDAREDMASYRPNEYGNKDVSEVSGTWGSDETNMNLKNPFIIEFEGKQHLSINLFQKNTYAGNLTLHFDLQEQHDSDIALLQYFARAIEQSFDGYSAIRSSRTNVFKSTLHDLLNGFPIDIARKNHLEEDKLKGEYVCIVIKLGYHTHSKVPLNYICNVLEKGFHGSVAFEFESSIILYINLHKLRCAMPTMVEELHKILRAMNLHAGASDVFTDLINARTYYRQACVAFDIGSTADPDLIYYPFQDYILSYMTLHSLGEFSLNTLMTEGLRKLQMHDRTSHASFVDTLRAFFNNGMNATKTAEELFLHRSTFFERLKRIEKILQTDLDDPDQRLHLLILLKIIDTTEKFSADNKPLDSLQDQVAPMEQSAVKVTFLQQSLNDEAEIDRI